MFPSNQTLVIPAGTINGRRTYTGFSCTPSTGPSNLPGPCPVIGVDPNFKQPYSAQWNLDIQRAITNAVDAGRSLRWQSRLSGGTTTTSTSRRLALGGT